MATVNNRPFTIFAYPYCYRLHKTTTIRFTVTGFNVHMKAVQTVRTMISVIAPSTCRHYKPTAYLAGKTVVTCVGFVISFFVLFPFVFSVHEILSS